MGTARPQNGCRGPGNDVMRLTSRDGQVMSGLISPKSPRGTTAISTFHRENRTPWLNRELIIYKSSIPFSLISRKK